MLKPMCILLQENMSMIMIKNRHFFHYGQAHKGSLTPSTRRVLMLSRPASHLLFTRRFVPRLRSLLIAP